jgi:hypothetical protein
VGTIFWVFYVFLVALIGLQTAYAETLPTANDFAFTATISAGKQSVQQFELPYPVLAGLQRADYGDLRIFNQQHQAVPFTVSLLEPQTQQQSHDYAVPFFRMTDHSTTNNKTGLQIEFTEQGTRLSFNQNLTGLKDLSGLPNYVIVENQHQTDDLQALVLHWQQPDEGFSIKVKLEASDDLQRWQTVNESTTLYDLKHANSALIQNTVSLSAERHARYLRLSFQPSSQFSLQINTISGSYQHSDVVMPQRWKSFALTAGEQSNEWLFNTGSFAPMTKIGFEIPAVGLFYQGSLYSKSGDLENQATAIRHHRLSIKHEVKQVLHRYPQQNTPPNPWQYQAAMMQYRLLTAAGEIESAPIQISTNKNRQWKLVLEQPATLLPEQLPKIKLGWQPVKITFLAQGNPPYQLFFGNAAVKPLNAVLPPSLDYDHAEQVELLAVQAVIKNPALVKQPTTRLKLNWQKIMLWLLLFTGVLLMGLMAYKLFLQMNQNKVT